MIVKERRYVYVKRISQRFNGSVVDMEVEEARRALKLHPEWIILGDAMEMNSEPQVLKPQTLACPLCSYIAKNNQALLMHKRKHI